VGLGQGVQKFPEGGLEEAVVLLLAHLQPQASYAYHNQRVFTITSTWQGKVGIHTGCLLSCTRNAMPADASPPSALRVSQPKQHDSSKTNNNWTAG
jgi:hypothetical protein